MGFLDDMVPQLEQFPRLEAARLGARLDRTRGRR